MRNVGAIAIALVGLSQSPAWAHHSDAGLDTDSILAFEGTVTEFAFRNPHVYVGVARDGEDGQGVVWALQMTTTNNLSRRGWRRDTLVPGDQVTVRVHPATDGRPYGVVESIDKEGGLNLAPTAETVATPATTTTLAGRWRADRSELSEYPGGFDGFFRAELELTEAARAAQAAYDPLSAENPESTCVGRPTPGALLSSHLYLLEFEIDDAEQIVRIRTEYFDEERTVYMDGRDHPPEDQRFRTGHALGRWEGDTLVIDTTNFADHRSPYQIGVPSGARKHVIERYRLIDGSRMHAEFTLEDPDYIAVPLSYSRELFYVPHEPMYRFNCDPDATRRFVR